MNGNWSVPTEEQVVRALASLTDVSLRQAFFSELANPEWLAPLERLGAFASEPGVTTDEEGRQRQPPWAEGDYLARVSSERPEDVVRNLLPHAGSQNPWVQRVIVRSAAKMPPSAAQKLVPAVVRIVETSAGWLDVPDVLRTMNVLHLDHRTRPVRALLNAMFRPIVEGRPENIEWELPFRTTIDEYFYVLGLNQSIPILLELGGISGLRLLGGWLMEILQPPIADDGRSYDPAYLWRPSIAAHPQNSNIHRVTDALIDALRDVSVGLSEAGLFDQVLKYLNEAGLFLMRRVLLEVASRKLEVDVPPELIDAAHGLLMDQTLLDVTARPEYVHLASSALPHFTQTQMDAWISMIQEGQWMGPDDAIERMTAWGIEDRSITGEDVARTKDHIRQRLLQPLRTALPPPLDQEVERLITAYGEIPHPEFSTWTESFVGSRGPLDDSELARMSPLGLLDYLRTWQPAGRHVFGGPTVAGLAGQLEKLATESPQKFEPIASELTVVGRSYARAVLSGWAKAASNRGYRPSDEAWRFVRAVAAMPDEPPEGRLDFESHDPTWRYSQRAALDVVIGYVRASDQLPDSEVRRLWGIISPLTTNPDPSPTGERDYSGTAMDPLTDSLNTLRPTALRAAILLATKSHTGDPGHPSETEGAIIASVAQHVGIENDASLAVAAAIGEGLGRMWSVDPDWVSSREETLFDVLNSDDRRRAWSDVAVSVAIRGYNTGAAFLKIVRPLVERMLTPQYFALEHTDGWRGPESVEETTALHLLRGYVFGLLPIDDALVQQLFSAGIPSDLKGKALGLLGWQFLHLRRAGPEPHTDVIERAQRLIEWRVELIRNGEADATELSDFHWWVRSEVFSADWWLPIVMLAIESDALDRSNSIGDELAAVAADHPDDVLTVFEDLFSRTETDWHQYDLLTNAPSILASALLTGAPEAVAHARRLLDELGRAGHVGLLNEVDQRLAAARAGSDDGRT